MNQLGVSLHIGTLLNEPESEAQAQFLEGFFGIDRLLSYMKDEGVGSIEIRNVREFMPRERSVAAIRAAQKAGFSVSLHVAFEKRSGREYADRVSSVLKEALGGQAGTVLLTVHPCSSDEETAALYADWAGALSDFDPRLRLALENMRVRKLGAEHNRLSHVIADIQGAPEPLRGACFDMGHYAYNVLRDGLPVNTCPPAEELRQIVHTHIHSLHMPEADTHFPILSGEDPVSDYIRALKSVGYGGIFNLELEPEHFVRIMPAHEGFMRSIAAVREMIQ